MNALRSRRLVAGIGADGKSRAVSDGRSPARFVSPGARFDVIWRVSDWPPMSGQSDEPEGLDRYSMQPAPGTVTWVMLELPPEHAATHREQDAPEVVSSRQRFDDAGVYEPAGGGWHRTDTLDFVVVVQGHVDLELDDGVRTLGPGDCVVQAGARHRWVNRGAVTCVLSGVIMGARPRNTR